VQRNLHKKMAGALSHPGHEWFAGGTWLGPRRPFERGESGGGYPVS